MNDRRRLMTLAPPLLAALMYGSPALAATPGEPDPAAATADATATAGAAETGPNALRPTGAETVPSGQETPMGRDERDAVQVVNRFWERNWSRHFPGAYTPPKGAGPLRPRRPAHVRRRTAGAGQRVLLPRGRLPDLGRRLRQGRSGARGQRLHLHHDRPRVGARHPAPHAHAVRADRQDRTPGRLPRRR